MNPAPAALSPLVESLGRLDYLDALSRMRSYTAARGGEDADRIWLTEHPPVFTLGQAGREEHLRGGSGVPLVRSDRGGQITYHGPGQVVAYVLIDLRRAGYGIRTLVRRVEGAMIATLAGHGVSAVRQTGRPGIYVGGAKIGAIGMRVSRGCSYHGCSLNVDCDLAPFAFMDTCGFAYLRDTSLRDLGSDATSPQVAGELGAALAAAL